MWCKASVSRAYRVEMHVVQSLVRRGIKDSWHTGYLKDTQGARRRGSLSLSLLVYKILETSKILATSFDTCNISASIEGNISDDPLTE